VVLFVLLFKCSLASISPLNLERIHFVDRTYDDNVQNFLFRGNQPQNENGSFAYNELRKYLEIKAVAEGGFQLPKDYLIYDISFLNPGNDGEPIPLQTEISFFANNPSLGKLLWWELVGDKLSPEDVKSLPLLRNLSVTLPYWQVDQLPLKMLKVRELLFTQANKPVVLYFHCGQGQDRTGEFAASYLMTYKGETFQSVWEYNKKVGMDVPENIHAMQWYCYYLRFGTNFNLDCQLSSDL